MSMRILLVDDFEPWRRFVCSTVQTEPELKLICEVSDGQAAIHKANELKPDLILLDIGLPKLNGIAAAREIRKSAPESKILFFSQESSADVIREALAVGDGFLAKADAYMELLPAIKAIMLDGRPAGSRLAIGAETGTGRASMRRHTMKMSVGHNRL
jgi:DNA-binding NarL/FixJ family response regulator